MPRGGYQKPSNPAAVSGPGALSRRTDGGPQAIQAIPAGGKYGERKAMQEMQSSAPMAGNPSPVRQSPLTELFAQSERPAEPVTAGAIGGLGPGPEALSLPNSKPSVKDTLRRLASVDDSGEIEMVLNMINQRGV
jgi:hypothetical protein